MHPQHQQQQWPPQQPVQSAGHRAEKKRPRWLIVAAVVGVLALGGAVLQLADGGEDGGLAASASASPAASTGVPTPDAEQRAAYLTALQEIDPGLVANEDRAVRRGRAVCDRIINPRENPSVEEYTVAALSGGNATINQAQARQVIKAVKAWCRP